MIPDLISRLQQLFGNISNIIDMAKMTYCKQLKMIGVGVLGSTLYRLKILSNKKL